MLTHFARLEVLVELRSLHPASIWGRKHAKELKNEDRMRQIITAGVVIGAIAGM